MHRQQIEVMGEFRLFVDVEQIIVELLITLKFFLLVHEKLSDQKLGPHLRLHKQSIFDQPLVRKPNLPVLFVIEKVSIVLHPLSDQVLDLIPKNVGQDHTDHPHV